MAALAGRLLLSGLVHRSSRQFYSLQPSPLFSKSVLTKQKCPTRLHPYWNPKLVSSTRPFSSSNGKESDGEGGEEEEKPQEEGEGGSTEEQEDLEEASESLGLDIQRHHAIAPINVPDHFPEVPVLPISRNPVFPRFVKMLEVRRGTGHSKVLVQWGDKVLIKEARLVNW